MEHLINEINDMKVCVSIVLLGSTLYLSGAEVPELKSQRDRLSYSLGLNIGANFKRQTIDTNDVDLDVLFRGFQDGVLSRETALTEKEALENARNFQTTIRSRMEERRRAQGEKNKREGDAFLATNKQVAGVITLPSGLQYKVLKEGSGATPKTNDTIMVHYRGTFLDGTEFDSSTKGGNPGPSTMPMSNLIKGWTEALQLMKVGSKWQLFVPSQLAYGERGYGQTIPPNTTLQFEMELVGFTPPAPSIQPSTEPVTSDIIKVPSAEELKKGAKIEIIKPGDLNKATSEVNRATPPPGRPAQPKP
jgi:FKBP-type peptidyl-prolyl cis-trans isomerase